MFRWTILLCGIAVLGAACEDAPVPESDKPAEITPQDFVLLPCEAASSGSPCALAIAGGKRVLFGAPIGAAASLGADDLRQLDAVIVFSLRAKDIEGLGAIRNASWNAGRAAPLLTIGPRGITQVVEGLNTVFEQSDALRIVEQGIPPGGFDAAIVTAREAMTGQTVFDTGDVQIIREGGGYRMAYESRASVTFIPCDGAMADQIPDVPDDQIRLQVGCAQPPADLAWPLRQAHFVVKNTPPE